MARRSAAGSGSIRKKVVKRNGKEYVYWEARYTEGTDPGTGRQIQRSVTGKTQKEVSQKLKAATASIDSGTYTSPNKMNLGQWLDIWASEYLGGVKPFTVASYRGLIKNHIKPNLGAIRLDRLDAHTIQGFYNSLSRPQGDKPGISPKTIKNVHGVLHTALKQAVLNGYLPFNPTDACKLPRIQRRELKPLDEEQTADFLRAIRGHRFEVLFTVTLFTGLRKGEVLGLTWDRVNFEDGTILIDRQLQREKKKGGHYLFAPLKNDKFRLLTPAPWVMKLLREHRRKQDELHLKNAPYWVDGGFVFTNEIGEHLAEHTVYKDFKAIAASIGRPDARFHDLRHSYAVAALRSGDDVKTIQSNMGHATAAFTMDTYAHFTNQMRKDSAQHMNDYIDDILSR